ncbi:class F sortase [Streptomyces sp. NPDC055085]
MSESVCRKILHHPATMLVLLVVLTGATYAVGIQIKTMHVSYAHVPPPQPSMKGLPPPLKAPEKRDSQTLPASPPVHIDVARLGIHADVMATGLNSDGSVAVPAEDDANRAAWYEDSAAPGQVGPSVIIGHVDSLAMPQGRAVFYALGAARPGDHIDITRADGTITTFAVDDASVIAKDSFPTQAVYGPTATPQLRLITCGGNYTSDTGYTGNVIVFAHYTGTRS